MDFAPSQKVVELSESLNDFMESHIYPAEPVFAEQVAANRWATPPVIDELKSRLAT